MATSKSSTFALSDGHELYEKVWTPSTTPKANIIFLHGFSDRIDHYDTFFNILLSSYPIRVIAWDRRGWGKSVHVSSERGNTGPMGQQISEVNELICHAFTDLIPGPMNTPTFLMGHSMGGQEATYYMLNTASITNDQRSKLAGFILESPYIGLDPATQPSAIKVGAGRILARFLPHFLLHNPVQVEYISPDKAVQKLYGDDPLCPGYASLECFRDMLEREAQLTALGKGTNPAPAALSSKLKHPVLWCHGTQDKATDYPTSKLLCDKLEPCGGYAEDKVFKSYDGWAHQLHSEPGGKKEEFAKDIGEWIMNVAARK